MIMKRILLFVVTSLCLFFVGCDNDDKDDVISLTPQELIQTTWDVELNRYTENGKVEHKEYGIIEFNSAVEGMYINGEGTKYFLEKTEKAGVRISDSGINKQKIQIKKDKKYQWYEKEQYYGIQVKIQKEILYPDQNLEKEKQKEILFCLVKS